MTAPSTVDPVLGVVSDTHGLVRPELVTALTGCDAILHAGDVGNPEVLSTLAAIAPLTAVRGNNDGWSKELPHDVELGFGGYRFYVVHDIADLDFEPASRSVDVVVYGHSHRPLIEKRGGVLFLNPGSAGPRRFRLPIVAARVRITGRGLEPELIELEA